MTEKIAISRETKPVNKSYGEYITNSRWKDHRSPAYHEYRRKWAENPQSMILEQFPLHIDVEITTYCNLSCPMCPRTIKHRDGSLGQVQHIDMELFKKIIDEGSEKGLCSVKFNYLGEPLMHPNVAEMVKYCKDKGILDVMFNTNAVLLNEKMSRNLLDAGIDGLFISFDSHKKEVYEAVRVGAKFEKVIDNIRKFVEIRNSDVRYWGTQIRVSKVVFPNDQEEDIENFIELWKDIVDAVGFGSYMEDLENELPYDASFRCDQPWQRLFIKENGIAFPCCRDNKLNYVVGDANTESISEIWQNEKYRVLREAHASGKYNQIAICSKCTYICASSVSFKE